MESVGGYIATIIVSLIIGYLMRFFRAEIEAPCMVATQLFLQPQEKNVVLQTNSLTVQNLGRKPAEGIEIIHQERPDFFEIQPSMAFTEITNPNGEHVIRIESLGSKEWFVVQMLSYKTVPQLLNVRWKDGQCKWIQIAPQRVWPKPLLIAAQIVLFIGVGTIAYWLIRVGLYLNTQIHAVR